MTTGDDTSDVHDAHRRELAEVTAAAEARVAAAEEALRAQSAELAELTRLLADYARMSAPAAAMALRSEAEAHALVIDELRDQRRPAGRLRGRRQVPTLSDLDQDAVVETVRRSPLFQPEWYLETYPDVQRADIDPALHYVRSGAREGRDPSPVFSTTLYASLHPDVAELGVNPLAHYELVGRAEGRTFTRPPEHPSD